MGDLTIPQVKFPMVGEDSVVNPPSRIISFLGQISVKFPRMSRGVCVCVCVWHHIDPHYMVHLLDMVLVLYSTVSRKNFLRVVWKLTHSGVSFPD